MLECKICNKKFKCITNAHLKTHNTNTTIYKQMFPGEILNPGLIEKNKSKEMRSKVSKALSNKPKTEDHKKALKEAKAKEDKVRRAKINGDNRRGKPMSREAIEKIAKNSNQKHPYRGKAGKREDLENVYFRSTWEANFARVLKLMRVEFQFEPKIFWLKRANGSEMSYTPDFYLPKTDEYIEVKGRWFDDAKEKFDLFKEQYPHIKIKVVDSEKYKVYESRFKHQIEEWE